MFRHATLFPMRHACLLTLCILFLTRIADPAYAQSFRSVSDQAESITSPLRAADDHSPVKPRRTIASPMPVSVTLDPAPQEKKSAKTVAPTPPGTPYKIGFSRDVLQLSNAADTARLLRWQDTPQGGKIAAISITSPQATGIRLGILVYQLPAEAAVRFYAQGAETAYETSGKEVMETIKRNLDAGDRSDDALTYWAPFIKGEEATIEIELPVGTSPDTVKISIPRISHFFSFPLAAPAVQGVALVADSGDSTSCRLDATCYSDWSVESKAIARMVYTKDGSSYLCTGTLLNDLAGSFTPYFLSAYHCISEQTAASTLQTYWFYQSTACDSDTLNPAYKTLFGGATLLYAGSVTDTSFMRLNAPPPGGVNYAGWNSEAPVPGTAVTGIHHPHGDLQKISFGGISSFQDCTHSESSSFTCIPSTQSLGEYIDITFTSGVTEGGSSGSGLFIAGAGGHKLIGQLYGGNATCSYPDGSNIYGRFDVAYNAALYQWLSNGPTYPLAISKSGNGNGTVTSSPVGINCGSTCSASFPGGTSVTLTATAVPGSAFSGWGGACSGTNTSCSVVMNAPESVTATFSSVTVLGTALDNTSLVWATGGSAPFTSQTTTFYYGGSAAQTGAIGSNQSTYLSTTVTGPGVLSFYWSVASEKDHGIFSVYLDGVKKYYLSGAIGWSKTELIIPAGSHTVKWEYVKDMYPPSGEDAGWVDYVVLITPTTPGAATPLYFPHVDANSPWHTEIAIINTSPTQYLTGTLKALNSAGETVDTPQEVILPARGRRQIIVADEFSNPTSIRYVVFDANSDTVQGYTKLYVNGTYRAAIPAVKEINTSDISIPHIASDAEWWTGVSLVNTTPGRKDLVITFNTGQSKFVTLNANEHRAFTIAELFDNQPQPAIRSAVITNASGVVGLELFGSRDGGSHSQLDGILLEDNTHSTLYYPHVAANGWWTGIVAYNPSGSPCTITVTAYSTSGTALASVPLSIPGRRSLVDTADRIGIPAQTAWFRIDSTAPLTGFELFGTVNANQLAAYRGGGPGTAAGVFPKIEKDGGWTGIAFVNTETAAASVVLTAYDDAGAVVDTRALSVAGHAKVVDLAENFFSQSIGNATYIAYASDRNVVGFQINGTSDDMMLDGLPGLAD
jgi:lysyl endopeptidase